MDCLKEAWLSDPARTKKLWWFQENTGVFFPLLLFTYKSKEYK